MQKKGLSFLALEYSGHGKSSGKFASGNISKWSKGKLQFNKKVSKNKFILVGSSRCMDFLIQFKYLETQIKGFLGVGSAPSLEDLCE